MLKGIKPGSKIIKKFKVGENADRSPVKLPVIIIKGKTKGPALLLNAAVHGNELIGVEVISRIMAELGPNDIKGTLVGVPIVNIPAYNAGLRNDPHDMSDMNRVFPGIPSGSITQQLAHYFYSNIVKEADYIIDFHSAEYPDVMVPHVRIRTKDPSGKSKMLSQAFGTELIWEGKKKQGMLQVTAVKDGKAVITVEIGAASVLDEGGITTGLKGVKNVMRVLGMLEGTAEIPEYQVYMKSDEEWIRSPYGGIFRPLVNVGGIVEGGQALGEIADPLNLKTKKLKAEYGGLIAGMKISPVVRTGTRLFFILNFRNGDKRWIEKKNLIKVPTLHNSCYCRNKILDAIMKG